MSLDFSSDVVSELAPTVQALGALGFAIVATHGGGAMLWAEFKGADTYLRMVKDRGFWHVDGDAQGLKISPSRKSQAAAVRDALKWIAQQTPNNRLEPQRHE